MFEIKGLIIWESSQAWGSKVKSLNIEPLTITIEY